MSSAAKRKGSAWEIALREHFLDLSIAARRNPMSGSQDIGDLAIEIDGTHYVIEAKATKAIDLPGFLKQAEVEAKNYASLNRLEEARPLVIVKRRSHGVDRSYVVQELGWWIHDHDR